MRRNIDWFTTCISVTLLGCGPTIGSDTAGGSSDTGTEATDGESSGGEGDPYDDAEAGVVWSEVGECGAVRKAALDDDGTIVAVTVDNPYGEGFWPTAVVRRWTATGENAGQFRYEAAWTQLTAIAVSPGSVAVVGLRGQGTEEDPERAFATRFDDALEPVADVDLVPQTADEGVAYTLGLRDLVPHPQWGWALLGNLRTAGDPDRVWLAGWDGATTLHEERLVTEITQGWVGYRSGRALTLAGETVAVCGTETIGEGSVAWIGRLGPDDTLGSTINLGDVRQQGGRCSDLFTRADGSLVATGLLMDEAGAQWGWVNTLDAAGNETGSTSIPLAEEPLGIATNYELVATPITNGVVVAASHTDYEDPQTWIRWVDADGTLGAKVVFTESLQHDPALPDLEDPNPVIETAVALDDDTVFVAGHVRTTDMNCVTRQWTAVAKR